MPDRVVDVLEMIEIGEQQGLVAGAADRLAQKGPAVEQPGQRIGIGERARGDFLADRSVALAAQQADAIGDRDARQHRLDRSEEHTSELQSLMRISYAVFCLKKKKQK